MKSSDEESVSSRDLINDVEQADNWIQAVGKKEFTALAYNKGKGIDYFYLVDTELRKKVKQAVIDYYFEKRSKAVDELDRIGKEQL